MKYVFHGEFYHLSTDGISVKINFRLMSCVLWIFPQVNIISDSWSSLSNIAMVLCEITPPQARWSPGNNVVWRHMLRGCAGLWLWLSGCVSYRLDGRERQFCGQVVTWESRENERRWAQISKYVGCGIHLRVE